MPPWVVQLLEVFGPMGFVMYLVWKFQHHTIPRLAKENHKAQEVQRTDFKEMLEAQRSDFKETIAHTHESHEKQTDRVIQAIDDLKHSA